MAIFDRQKFISESESATASCDYTGSRLRAHGFDGGVELKVHFKSESFFEFDSGFHLMISMTKMTHGINQPLNDTFRNECQISLLGSASWVVAIRSMVEFFCFILSMVEVSLLMFLLSLKVILCLFFF